MRSFGVAFFLLIGALGTFTPLASQQDTVDSGASARFNAQAKSKRLSSSPMIKRLPEILDQHKQLANQLELLPEQIENITRIRDEFKRDIEQMDETIANHPDIAVVRKTGGEKIYRKDKFRTDLAAVLLPHQQELLANCDMFSVGLSKLVTNSMFGESLQLSDSQKHAIEKESHELAMEIERFIHQSRKRSRDIVLNNLSKGQKKRLMELVPSKTIETYAGRVRLGVLVEHYVKKEDRKLAARRIFQSNISDK